MSSEKSQEVKVLDGGFYPTYLQFKALTNQMTTYQQYQWTLDLMEICLPDGTVIQRRKNENVNVYATTNKKLPAIAKKVLPAKFMKPQPRWMPK